MPRPSRRRLCALLALVLVIAAGLAVHRLLPESAASDIAGDVLYAVAAYAGLVMVFPRAQPWVLGAAAAVWCVGIEVFQLTGVPEQIGAAFPPAMLLLGTVFDARDLVVYPVAIMGAVLVDISVRALLVRTATASESGAVTNNTHELGADRTP